MTTLLSPCVPNLILRVFAFKMQNKKLGAPPLFGPCERVRVRGRRPRTARDRVRGQETRAQRSPTTRRVVPHLHDP
jgi:hypothetical protein